jgi:hypothetical protein
MKVFLSSTAQDLVAYRQVADDTILRLSQEPVVMERFGPLPGEPVAERERKARESDVVVCIVAHRYGFVPDVGKGSITRREVEAAKAAGKDVLVWIVADDHAWSEKSEQDLLTDPIVLADPARIAKVVKSVRKHVTEVEVPGSNHRRLRRRTLGRPRPGRQACDGPPPADPRHAPGDRRHPSGRRQLDVRRGRARARATIAGARLDPSPPPPTPESETGTPRPSSGPARPGGSSARARCRCA